MTIRHIPHATEITEYIAAFDAPSQFEWPSPIAILASMRLTEAARRLPGIEARAEAAREARTRIERIRGR